MMRALWSAATGMIAQELNVDTIANNLANVNTAGFKRQRVDFEDLLYETTRMPGSPSADGVQIPTGIQVGLGTRAASTSKMFDEGTLQETGNPLDLTIGGDGFFKVTLPSGKSAYTRAGNFKQDSTGSLVTSDGYALDPPVIIPPDAQSLTVGEDGTVSVIQGTSTAPTKVGQIQIARFMNPAGLLSIGQNLFTETAASGTAAAGTPGLNGLGQISQNVLEMSNVKVVQEMVQMITAQRAYEANSEAIKIADQMLQTANNVRQ
ncbi:MAG TPA: flagellar basal-body rod protein FlgG [Armatimonadota bacterium]|jgi:flagellar basal-body rod protein FlgG